MKLVLAHEYFGPRGGAERVVETLHAMWPDAPVYTFFHDRRRYGDLPGWTLRTSYLQWLLLGESHRLLLPLYPNAARALHVPPDTDVALVSTSAFIKGISLSDRTVAVAYCHSPTRYLYDWSDRYLEQEVPAPLVPLVRDLLGRLREDDQKASRRLDRWMANSNAVRGRIETYYGIPAETIDVVHPPVDVDSFSANDERGDFWLFVGRLSPYKRADVAVRAFNDIGMRLLVVGEGRERGALERIASENVVFAGRADDATLRSLLASARGLVFPAEDDFGIVCVEALASGAPVVALAAGGVFDIVRDGEEGVLVDVPEPRAFAEGVLRAERARFKPQALRDSARRFDVSLFRERVRSIVDDAYAKGRT
ncbi:MAG TPA: glycosyltransferase [Candidatus Limnocylindria bacterium]|jgi:glycosyltransferase involved in cell wall biosynthesis|nr:glycosyltransferase [Candidatus Limnocylindria bacterium]